MSWTLSKPLLSHPEVVVRTFLAGVGFLLVLLGPLEAARAGTADPPTDALALADAVGFGADADPGARARRLVRVGHVVTLVGTGVVLTGVGVGVGLVAWGAQEEGLGGALIATFGILSIGGGLLIGTVVQIAGTAVSGSAVRRLDVPAPRHTGTVLAVVGGALVLGALFVPGPPRVAGGIGLTGLVLIPTGLTVQSFNHAARARESRDAAATRVQLIPAVDRDRRGLALVGAF